jgi:predicted PurR-regulated permease PerM
MAEPKAVGPGDVARALGGVAALWIPVLALHLTPALFAALITHGGTRALAAVLQRRWPQGRHLQAWALALLLGGVALLGVAAGEHLVRMAATGRGYAALLQQLAAALDQLRAGLPAVLSPHVPASLEALREWGATWLRGHAAQVQLWGGHTVRGLGHALAGVVIGALLALRPPPVASGAGAGAPLEAGLRRGFDALVDSFAAVVFAQLRIALLNTALTALYLLVLLPLLGAPLPLAGTLLVATFVASLVPVLGNLVSNAMIVVVSLAQSPAIAGLSLLWLVLIHKLEYVLNAHIVGGRIRARAWELLTAMLVLEAAFGLAGLVSAPVIYAQAKSALIRRGWL